MPEPGSSTRLWFASTLLPEGWCNNVRFTLAGGKILRVETGVDAGPEDERHPVALPGLSNLHSHAFQRGMAGLAERRGPDSDNFWTWREVMYRFLDRLTPDDVEAVAAQAYVEMLETGFTRVGEFHYLHHAADGMPYGDIAEMGARIAAAANETGIALTLLPVFYAHADFGGAAPLAGQRRFISTLDGFAKLFSASHHAIAGLADARLGVAPHSLRAVTPEELGDVVAFAADGPIHIHAAEQVKEVEDCLAWSGLRPVQWLLDHVTLDRRWCLVHATHMTAEETRALAATGATAGLCPVTEANLGDGIFPAEAWLGAGGAFGIGTDSNILIDPAEELRALEYAQRLARRARNVLAPASDRSTGRALFGRALSGGARALAAETAGLAAGAPADFFSLDPAHPALAGRTGDALLDSWIFAGWRGAVDCVWRAGVKLVENGRHRGRGSVLERYSKTVARLLG